ncbi:MAG: DUF1385 domain-containing protein [Limnochordia bacterium]
MSEKFSYGGQAVIEGVMMRGRRSCAIAVRTADQGINLHEEKLHPWGERYPILKKPILRGFIALIESLILGIRSLNHSASLAAAGEEEELGLKELVLTMGFAILLTVGMFIMLPAFIIRNIQGFFASNILLNLVEGSIKISFFILYIVIISQMEDIKRVFQYHGAEHMAINCYENGEELTVENVAKYGTIHPRCGTNFMLIVFFTSIFIFSFFGRPPFWQRVATHLAILPLVAGISYELIRWAGKAKAKGLIGYIAAPGMMLQKLTTRKPDPSQLEVAIAALEAVRQVDAELGEPIDLQARRCSL